MADIKISELPAATSVGNADIFVMDQGLTTKTASRSLIVDGLQTALTTAAPLAISQGGTGAVTSTAALQSLGAASIDSVTAVSSAVAGLVPASIGAASTLQIQGLATTLQLAAITPASIGALSTAQAGSFIATSALSYLATTSQVAAISPASIGAFATSQIIAIGSGGTGATTQQSALNALAGAVTANQVLKGNGTNITLAALVSSDIPTLPISKLSGVAASGANTDITSVALTSGTVSTVPSGASDIVNKEYADAIGSGINFHDACNYATLAALSPSATYNQPGGAGVGVNATLTGSTNAVLQVDGATVSVSQRILVKDQASTFQNGIYVVTQQGDGSSQPYILTRAADYDTSGSGTNEVQAGDFVLILAGTLVNTAWVQQTPAPINFGVTSLNFIQFAAAASGVASFVTTLSGLTPSINTNGAVTLAGTLGIANGGTGSTTSAAAINALGITPSAIGALATSQAGGFIATSAFSYLATTAQVSAITPSSIGAVATSAIIAISNGGTGQTAHQAALTALAGTQASGQYLRSNGTDTLLSAIQAGDVPTLNQNTTGTAANVTGTVAIANGGTGATDAGTARFNLGIPIHYTTVRASVTQAPIALAGPYAASVTTGTTGVTLTTGDTSLLAIGMTFGTTALAGCAIASITNSTQFVLSANASATLTAAAIVVYNTSNTTFTYPPGAQAALEGHTVAVGDVVLFSSQAPTPTNGAWQCSVAGATGVSQVMVRPTWFTGTVNPQLNIVQRGTTSQSLGWIVYPTTAVDADIVVGQTPLTTFNSITKTTAATTGANSFSSTQTFPNNTALISPFRLGTSVAPSLLTTPVAGGFEFDGTYAYLTPATNVNRRGLADGAIFHITVLQNAALTVATPAATTLTFAVGVQAAIDGHTLALYDTILLTAQAAPAQNGPWIVTTVGTAGVAAVWTRPGWFQGSTVRGSMAFNIFRGTTFQGATRILVPTTPSDADITVGTTSLTVIANATSQRNTYQQLFAAGTTAQAPAAFGAASVLKTTPAANDIEWDGTYAYLVGSSGARYALPDGTGFFATVRNATGLTVSVATATTLTFAVGVQTAVDSHTLALGDLVVNSNQTDSTQNGPWIITTLGTGSVAAVWTRPNWFSGTVRNGMTVTFARGTIYQSQKASIYSAVAGDSDITVGTTTLTVGTIFSRPIVASYLAIAGGGSGGGGTTGVSEGGGGGAGGYLTGSVALTTGTVVSAVVGAGGAAASIATGSIGNNTTLVAGSTILTCLGGGGGGGTAAGTAGGSGGGSFNTTIASGTTGQGNNGGGGDNVRTCGGGGGAGAVGATYVTAGLGANGGAGLANSITGSSVTYAGGGGGCGNNTAGTGGTGGGGAASNSAAGTAGTANLGAGGGGSDGNRASGAGGSGVVILSLPTATYTGAVTGAPTVTTFGGTTVIKFTASGTYTA
jgi:hypothetical protein